MFGRIVDIGRECPINATLQGEAEFVIKTTGEHFVEKYLGLST